MKAMILCAGLGTRLRPITDTKPKALVEVQGKPLLEWIINRLKNFGFKEIIINVHYLADQIIDFLNKKNNFEIDITISDERDLLLDTGGGLKKAGWFFKDDSFLLHNVDILSNINLSDMMNYHKSNKALATLAVQNRDESRCLMFDDTSQLCGWTNLSTGDIKQSRVGIGEIKSLAFSGIHIIHPNLLNLISEEGVFSIIHLYLRLAKEHKILSFKHDDSFFIDIGTEESLNLANQMEKFFINYI